MVETRMAGALKISRTPVREAIHKLEREGLLCPYPGGGFIVAEMSRADIEETFGIRCVLESYAARLAAQFHRDEELIPLEEKIREFQECLDQGQMESLLQINTQFHDLLYGLSRSPRLIRMINDLRDPIYRFRKLILRIKDMAAASNEDHRAMLRLIRKRDSRGVELLVKEHIMKGQKAILEKGANLDW
jgi:DNA-binding GntR family transcriptional regulator